MRFEMDESEGTLDKPAKWWDALEDTSAFVRFHYDEIMEHGSDELKNAAEIILNGQPPAAYTKEESA